MILDVLLEKPRTKWVLIIFIVSFTLYFIFQFLLFGPIMNLFPPGADLMAFKNAWTKAQTDAIIAIWIAHPLDLVSLMMIVHHIDWAFMVVYGTAISTACLLLARGMDRIRWLRVVFLYTFFLAWIAVAFDVIEGINIFTMLLNPLNTLELNAFWASLSTTICIAIICMNLFMIIAGAVIVLILYIIRKKE